MENLHKVSLANRYREPEKDGQRLAKQIARNYCRLQSLGFPREIAAIKAWVCHKETGGIEC